MSSTLRAPLLHFLLLGALLFFVQDLLRRDASPAEAASRRIAIDIDRIDELETSFIEQTGRRPGPAETKRMIQAEVDEEILFREAARRGLLDRDSGVQTRLIQKMLFLEGGKQIEDAPALLGRAIALGLHREDIVVRRILVQKMKLLGSTLRAGQLPTAREIEAAYRAQRERLRAPDRRTLTHVFLSADRRGTATRDDALALRERIAGLALPPSEAPALGDPFPLGHRLGRRSQDDLQRLFGARFGQEVFDLAVGRWSTPIPSAYGEHLILIEEKQDGAVPPLDQVANRLRLEIEEGRRNENLEALVSDLRTRYQVVLPTAASTKANPPPPAAATREADDAVRRATENPLQRAILRPNPSFIQEETG